jgi:glutamate dehydrogenase
MTQHADAAANDVVEQLVALAHERLGEHGPLVGEYLRRYVAATDSDDLVRRPVDDLFGAALWHWQLGRHRSPGQTIVRVLSPEVDRDGWSSPHSVVLLITDDAPFLVDSVRMVLERHGLGIHLMIHPMLGVRRDRDGVITDFPARGGHVEAWTQMEIDRCDAGLMAELERSIATAIADVHLAVDDFEEMRARTTTLAERLEAGEGPDSDAAHQGARLLQWLVRRHFVFLGAADYECRSGRLKLRSESVLGLARNPAEIDPPFVDDGAPVVVARADRRSTVHRASRLTCISVRRFDESGRVVGEHRLVGLFSALAYRESVTAVPLVREKVAEVLRRADAPADSHTGRAVRTVLESFPRDELFEIDVDALYPVVMGIVGLQERQLVRAFVVHEHNPHYATALVYLPRQRFTIDAAARVAVVVRRAFGGDREEHSTLVGTSALARVTVSVRCPSAPIPAPDLDEVVRRIDALTTTWLERLRSEMVAQLGEGEGLALLDSIGQDVPPSYTAVVEPRSAVGDLVRLASVARAPGEGAALTSALVRPTDSADHVLRFRVYRRGAEMPLADVLPLLDHLGLSALDERPFRFAVDGTGVWLYDIGVRLPDGVRLDEHRDGEVRAAFAGLVSGEIEADGLNRLVLAAGLTCRQVDVLRAYAKYLRQVGFPFRQATIEDTLVRLPGVAANLARLFDTRFDPGLTADRAATTAELVALIDAELDAVPSLDDDRIGRAFLHLVMATTRTNAFRPADGGGRRPVLAFKLDPMLVADLPLPRPMHEIWVHSARVEGVHLRGGPVARGGIRWSDRRDDFRTEILGLLKAQMVKNAVIVPTGAKGGFVVKRPLAAGDALRAEVLECYRMFIAGLLDVTDNLVAGAVVPPPDVVRYDGDDPYLVVAADKGTAAFSDVANEISAGYGFWLGDAFASGGSAGYDHKAMGITARGAWESVRRHAQTLGLDADRDAITVVGIGDMSGDVFGNGMLCSANLRLVAAFDHRHIFLDPDPDPARAFDERRRLFELPRSSWADYDVIQLSPGGAVVPRSAKVVPISAQVRARLAIEADSLSPNELISAILRAPVDLLWNGGIGTYVKASDESHAEVGDRANDAVRVDGAQLRCRMVGEGGNLGLTQRGRVEYALAGGLVYTDAIDNSAGVDTSDHEVNIKILLGGPVADGRLTSRRRNELLASMTDEVAELVLDDNRAQTLALAIARRQALPMLNVHARYLNLLEAEGWLDRSLEHLPTEAQLADRQAAGTGLTTPEFAVLLAYTKNANVVEVVKSDLPDDPYLVADLVGYFPRVLQEQLRDDILGHRLRREIIATTVGNQMVNLQGISFDHRMTEETGLGVPDITRAWVAARDVLGTPERWAAIESIGDHVSLDEQIDLFLEARRMTERVTLWLLRRQRPPVDIARTVATLGAPMLQLEGELRSVLAGAMAEQVDRIADQRHRAGVPQGLANRSALWPILHIGPDMVELARRYEQSVTSVAATYWGLFDRLDLFWLWERVGALPRNDRWETQARSAVRDDLLGALVELTDGALSTGHPLEGWLDANLRAVERMRATFREIRRGGTFDLTTLSVGVRQLRNLALSHGRPVGR